MRKWLWRRRTWRRRTSCTLCAPSARHRDGSSADACGHRRCPLPLVPACAVKRGCSSSGCAYWCPTSTTPSHAIRAGRNRCVAAGLSTRVTLTFHQHELTTLVSCRAATSHSPHRCPGAHSTTGPPCATTSAELIAWIVWQKRAFRAGPTMSGACGGPCKHALTGFGAIPDT